MHSIKSRVLFLCAAFSLTFAAVPQAFSQWLPTATLSSPYVFGFGTVGNTLFIGTQGGIFKSPDNGTTWIPANTGFTGTKAITFVLHGSNLFVGSDSGIFVSADMGASWVERNNGLKFGLYKQVNAFAQNGNYLFAGGYNGVFISTDEGLNWQDANTGLSGLTVLSMASSGQNIFAGTVSYVYLSTNNGANWSIMKTGLANNLTFSLLATEGHLYAGSNAGVAFSTNNGSLWTPDTSGMSYTVAYALAGQGSDIFCGTFIQTGTIYHSSNAGASWDWINDQLPDTVRPIYAVAISGANLYIGTNGSGVWRRPLSNFGISAVTEQTPASISPTTYPNPFSQSTTINFSSQESGTVEVTIVNLLGQQVARLFDGELDAGEHSFEWDASGAAAGTYFCIVHSNGGANEVPIILSP